MSRTLYTPSVRPVDTRSERSTMTKALKSWACPRSRPKSHVLLMGSSPQGGQVIVQGRLDVCRAEHGVVGVAELAIVFLRVHAVGHGSPLLFQELRRDPRALGGRDPVALPPLAALPRLVEKARFAA